MELLNKIALVTGASSGIGQEISARFLAEGAFVFGCGIESIASIDNDKFKYKSADLTDYNQATNVVNECVSTFGGIDILVNCAGITGVGSVETTSPTDFERQFQVNVFAVYNITKAAVPYLKNSHSASIVNISSELGVKAIPERIGYCPSKAAIVMLTKCLAIELGPIVRVNAILPALTETPMTKERFNSADNPSEFRRKMNERYIMKRIGQPNDIAEGAVFLASARSSFITGDMLAVCGGGHIYSCPV